MDDILEFLKPNKERENTLRGEEYLRLFLLKKNPLPETIPREKTFWKRPETGNFCRDKRRNF